MSQCIVPKWNQRQQRQEMQVEGEVRNRSPHVQPEQDLTYVVPMSNIHEVAAELTWENGQISLHGLGGIDHVPSAPQVKQTWGSRVGDSTLESIVHQAVTFKHGGEDQLRYNSTSSMPTSMEQQHIQAGGKWAENSSHMQVEQNGGVKDHTTIPMRKWTENPAHMQVEQNGGVEVKANSMPSTGKYWRENIWQHLQMDEEKGLKLSSINNNNNNAATSGGKWEENSNKRVRSDQLSHHNQNQIEEMSGCGSASATFCRETDTTMMTWPNSFESQRSLKTATRNTDDDSVYHACSENQHVERVIKGESFRSLSSARRSRAAAIHNQSERRRRDRINEKMKALQKLVPNASKTDKASMLDEVIEYLKQLQAQVYMMSNARNMVMPLGMQQQLHHQMSFLARMGMGMGMGMGMLPPHLIHAAGAAAPLPFTMPPVVSTPPPLKPNVDAAASVVPCFNDVYNAFLAQSMNMDFLNKISALYRQQGSQLQPSKKPVSLSLPIDGQQQ